MQIHFHLKLMMNVITAFITLLMHYTFRSIMGKFGYRVDR